MSDATPAAVLIQPPFRPGPAAGQSRPWKLTEGEVKALLVVDKWLARVQADVLAEVDRVSQSLIRNWLSEFSGL